MLVCDGRVTGEALPSLLEAAKCKAWLYADERWTLETTGAANFTAKSIAFPSIEWCLDAADSPDYPYSKTWEEGAWEPNLVLHTSGTTGKKSPRDERLLRLTLNEIPGFPKPIFGTNAVWGSTAGGVPLAARKHFPRHTNLGLMANHTELNLYPPKWGAGIGSWVIFPSFYHTVLVIPPADVTPMTPAIFAKILAANPTIQGMHTSPQFIIELWNDTATTRPLLKRMEYVLYGGASLDKAVGDELAMHTRLAPVIAATDAGLRISILPHDRKLWNSVLYVPEGPHRFVKREGSGVVTGEDLYELVFEREKDGTPSYYHGAFWYAPARGLKEFETRELYAPVEDSNGERRWVLTARADDLLKLSWLAKFHAGDIESAIQKDQRVGQVLVGGQGREVPFVLIEPKEGVVGEDGGEAFLDELYATTIAGERSHLTEEVRIPRETVGLAKKEKPFQLNMKQGVIRREVEKDYKDEIEALYEEYAKARLDREK